MASLNYRYINNGYQKKQRKLAKTSSNSNKIVLKQENEKHLLDVFQNLKSSRESWNSIREIKTVKNHRKNYQDSKTVLEWF